MSVFHKNGFLSTSLTLRAMAWGAMASLLAVLSACGSDDAKAKPVYRNMGELVNQPTSYPVTMATQVLKCEVDAASNLGTIHPRIFGTNLEWFNEAGGLASKDVGLKQRLTTLAREQGTTVMRYPGGTLSDFYHWQDGVGAVDKRPKRKHPTDSGSSDNTFGSPEFFTFLKATHREGLITVNAGTASAQEAADWVAYANQPNHSQRVRDGISEPANIKLWEIGNELYLPGNPGEQIITVKPEVYAKRYIEFARAMRAVDNSITTIAIGVAKSHIGPDTEFPEWSEVLLKHAADEIDLIAVHNAYFPMLYTERQPDVKDVYPALWASPEAVDRSLTKLERLIQQHEKSRKIGIAITEWGALFSLPNVDNYWVDHVKTMGSGVYMGRMLQVMMSHPRVQLANYFKLTDRSFMGWINYAGEPKVPYWVLALYANNTGSTRLSAKMQSPTYDTQAIGIMMAEKQVPELTAVASKSEDGTKLYINFVNRSMTTNYPVQLDLKNAQMQGKARLLSVKANEMTAHNGRDIPPEWPYDKAYEPYSTAPPNSIKIKEQAWDMQTPLHIAPFSVITLVIDIKPMGVSIN